MNLSITAQIRSLFLLSAFGVTAAASPQQPDTDSLVLLGSLGAPPSGQGAVVPAQGLVQLRVPGPDPLCFEVDLNDPAIREGYLRVYERESDSYPIYDGGMSYRDTSGQERPTAWLADRCTYLGAWTNGTDLVYMDYEDDVAGGFGGGGGVHHRRQVVRLVGRCLQVEVIDLDQSTQGDGVYAGLFYGRLEGLDNWQALKMQGALGYPLLSFNGPNGSTWYWSNCIDLFQTNATTWFLGNNTQGSIGWGMNTYGRYYKNSAGQLEAPVHDTLQICVSQRLRDTFIVNAQGASPYRDFVSRRAVVLLDGQFDQWSRYVTLFDMFDDWGLRNIVGYVFHGWSDSSGDCGGENRGPDWYPAKRPVDWTNAFAKANSVGFAIGAVMRFSAFNPATAPAIYNVPSYFARNASGAPKLEFQLCPPAPPFPLWGTGAQALHSQREHSLVAANYGHSAAYIDAMTYASPTGGAFGDYVDQTAGSFHGRSVKKAIAHQKSWMDEARSIVGGPLLGEGSVSTAGSNTEWIWAGYVDSVQRHINTGSQMQAQNIPASNPLAITAWPVIPEYELRAAKLMQANHGNGFYYRFFGPVDGPSMVTASGYHHVPIRLPMHDRYRAYEITYGHTPYFPANGTGDGLNTGNFVYFPQMIQEYYQLLELSRRYFERPVQGIFYERQGSLRTFEEIWAASADPTQFIDPRLHLDYGTLDIFVNHSPTPWNVLAIGGVDYTIPEDGWVAYDSRDGFVCFSAIPAGVASRIDYCYAPGRYELFNGRGSVLGYGGIVTGSPGAPGLLQVRNFADNSVIHEKTQVQLPSGFWTASWEVVASTPFPVTKVVLQPSRRTIDRNGWAGIVAIAHRSNGSWEEVTTKVNFTVSNPALATVDRSGVVRGLGVPGAVQITASPFQNVAPRSVTLLLR